MGVGVIDLEKIEYVIKLGNEGKAASALELLESMEKDVTTNEELGSLYLH